MIRPADIGRAVNGKLAISQWPSVMRLAAAPGAILILISISIAITLGALIFAQHANTSIVDRDMHIVLTLGSAAGRFDRADGDLQRLMVDKAAHGVVVDIPTRTASIKTQLTRARLELLALQPSLTVRDQHRMTNVLGQLDRYAEAVDVVSSMLDVNFAASIEMLTPFRSNANLVIADVDSMAQAGIADAREHARIAAQRTRILVWLVSAAMVGVAILSMAWLALASYRGLKLREEIRLRKEAESSALRLARHDPLTGLANRRVFVDAIASATGTPDAESFAVILIDLDAFKDANDLHGHAAGDEILRAVANRLSTALPERAVLARLGGDEFAIMTPTPDRSADLHLLLEQVSLSLHEPLEWRSVYLRMGASMGVSLFPNDGRAPDTLLHAADIAMYQAKRLDKGTFRFFEVEMEVERMERRSRETELRGGIEAGQIVPFYQPIVQLADHGVCGFEILARWQHPRLGLLPPNDFIALAEATGQITALTESLLKKACSDILCFPADLRFAINVSPSQLAEAGLAERLIGIVNGANVAAHRIEIELTEDAIMDDLALAEATIGQFRASGMSVAIDDFGTGFSCLSNLRRLRFDKIKIDQSFVQSMLVSEESEKLVDAIISLASSFEMNITAEGIEDMDTARLLAGKGCTQGQGFLFGKPLPFDQASEWVKDKRYVSYCHMPVGSQSAAA